MSELPDLDPLFYLSNELDEVEWHLRQTFYFELADQLKKLQQDAGYTREQDMPMFDPDAGPITSGLGERFEPVTLERLEVLCRIHAVLHDYPLKQVFKTLMDDLGIDQEYTSCDLAPPPQP